MVLLWFLSHIRSNDYYVFGLSLVISTGVPRTVLGQEILTKGTFANIHTFGDCAYPVRHNPIAVRLRDRKGRAILCIALFPHYGDSSGAILEVPFKALLHLDLLQHKDSEGRGERNLKKTPFCIRAKRRLF